MNQGILLDLPGPPDGPDMDPVTQILGDPDQKNALQGPRSILVNFYIDLKTTEKLKFTA